MRVATVLEKLLALQSVDPLEGSDDAERQRIQLALEARFLLLLGVQL